MKDLKMKANITEIFNSISGEVNPWYQGCLTTFVRLARCNLKCPYCDTPESMGPEYTEYTIQNLLVDVNLKYQKTGKLCITGGEPLIQADVCKVLIENFPNCWIETNGTYNFTDLIGEVALVADYKLFMMENEIPPYFYRLKRTDFVKFVIGNIQDIVSAQKVQQAIQTSGCLCNFAYSPLYGEISAKEIFDTLIENSLPNTIINVQIHKYLEMK